MKSEAEIQAEILIQLGFRYAKRLRAWRNNSGAVKIGDRFVKFGLSGQGDISGIMFDGKRLEIEVKRQNGRQSKEQKRFQAMIEKFNGIYILARSFEDVKKVLDKYEKK